MLEDSQKKMFLCVSQEGHVLINRVFSDKERAVTYLKEVCGAERVINPTSLDDESEFADNSGGVYAIKEVYVE